MIKKSRRGRFKIQRRLMTELPGLGKSGALARRPYPPGEHGAKRRKFSEFALQLEEKQKIRANYALKEEQLLRFIRDAKRHAKTNWVDALANLLEKRLDNTVFRLGFAPSIKAARQMIVHKQVRVNGATRTISSQVLKLGDLIELREEAYQGQNYLSSTKTPRIIATDYLSKTAGTHGPIGKLISEPGVQHIPFAFEPGLFVSYYSL